MTDKDYGIPIVWLTTPEVGGRTVGGRTAFIRPQDFKDSPLVAIAAIRSLVSDGIRVIIGRGKVEGTEA